MKLLLYLSDFMIPFLLFYIVAYGLIQKHNIYEEFVTGAKDGLHTVVQILPTLIGLMVAVGVLRASGFLDLLSGLMGKIVDPLGFPVQLVPLSIVKMFSSSASTGLLLDLYKNYGTDSMIGLAASISMSCTETIFYTMSVYFVAAKVTKTRYTLAGAMAATLAGLAMSVLLAGMMI